MQARDLTRQVQSKAQPDTVSLRLLERRENAVPLAGFEPRALVADRDQHTR
jgi:hypothetical protein